MFLERSEISAVVSVFRQIVYFCLLASFFFCMLFFAKMYGNSLFEENGVIENIQLLLLLSGVATFFLQAKFNIEFRAILFLLGSCCLLAVCRELDFVFAKFFPVFHWRIGFLFPLAALLYANAHRNTLLKNLFSFYNFPAFYMICLAFFVIIPIAQIIDLGYFERVFGHNYIRNRVQFEEIIETIGYFIIVLAALEMYFNLHIFDKLYAKFGKDIEFKPLSLKKAKAVYNIKTSLGEFVLIVLPRITVTRFYKYMSSQGVQQQLFFDDMDAAEIVYAYMEGDNVVSVHRKFAGSYHFASDKEMLAVSGKIFGKLHRISLAPQYKKEHLLINYPNVVVRVIMYFRYILWRRISEYYKYFSLRKLPFGICHRDNNGRNVLVDDKGHQVLIDFDKHRHMPCVEALIYFYRKHLKDKSLFHIFLEAYETERPLTKEERDYLVKTLQNQ